MMRLCPMRPLAALVLAVLAGPLAATPPAGTGRAATAPERDPARSSRLDAAGRSALRAPERDSYVNAVQVYAWSEGALYRLHTAPGRVSEIALEPGEALISVAAGDTARWVIGDTSSGSGEARRTHILVKPTRAGLRTNLVITTDRRVYRIELGSDAGAAMAGIAWTYPHHALLAVRPPAGADREAAPPATRALALETLDFGYRIEGDEPAWRPLRAFDDGRQVFIHFPATIAQGEAPPLFIRGADGRAELVNYRVRGRYYIVDRLFETAELRLGGKRQQVVRIVRSGPQLPLPRARARP